MRKASSVSERTTGASPALCMNPEPPDSTPLAGFQAAMLDILHAEHDPATIRARLMPRARDAGLAEYVSGFDDRMLFVAAELVRKWGERTMDQNAAQFRETQPHARG